jgi:hypothetical protein
VQVNLYVQHPVMLAHKMLYVNGHVIQTDQVHEMYAAGFEIENFHDQKCREVRNLYTDEPLVSFLIETSLYLKYNLNFMYPNYSCNFIDQYQICSFGNL